MSKIEIEKKFPKCFKCKCEVKDNKFLLIDDKKYYYHLYCLDTDILYHCMMLIDKCDDNENDKKPTKNNNIIQYC